MLTLVPSHAEAQSRLGAVLMAQGKTGQALSHLEHAVALKPDLFEAHGNLAQAYLAAGHGERAVLVALRALELRDRAGQDVVRSLRAQCAVHR